MTKETLQPSDLRIGNWVNTKHGYGIVTRLEANTKHEAFGIGVTCMPMRRYVFENAEPTPIILTPEILEKCGFTGDPLGIEITADFYIRQSLNPEILNLYYGNDFAGISLVYLHQLQNLYYALTGKYLEVKM